LSFRGSQKSGFDVSFDVSAQPNSAQPNGVSGQEMQREQAKLKAKD
jgi:hypothetical protein